MLTGDGREKIADERGTGDTSYQRLNFHTFEEGEIFHTFEGGEIFQDFFRNISLFASCIVERRDRICRKGRIGDTGQKEGNSEFSFLAKFRKGEFFTSAVTRRVAMLLPCFLRYPGMLQGYVLLLGNFPSMPIPIDQTEAARYGAARGGGGVRCNPLRGQNGESVLLTP